MNKGKKKHQTFSPPVERSVGPHQPWHDDRGGPNYSHVSKTCLHSMHSLV